MDPLLRFYRLEGRDARGRPLADIWTWGTDRLESVHDYIQWLFPLPEPSAFNPDAPILTEATARAFRDDPVLRGRLLRSLELMLGFYGLALATEADGEPSVTRGADFPARSRGWLRAGDHNHLRLTRILTSLRLLGLPVHARALFACLEAIARDHPGAISRTTVDVYWRRAAGEEQGAVR